MRSNYFITGIILLISILSPYTIIAKSLDKLYVSLLTDKGTVYHTYPMNLVNIDNANKRLSVSKLKYDYTYVDSKDSVDILISVSYNILSKPEHISFDGTTYYPTSIIYIDNKDKRFIYRFQCTFPYKEWIKLYSSINHPFTVNLYCEDGTELKFSCPQKKWAEISGDFRNLFNLIDTAR